MQKQLNDSTLASLPTSILRPKYDRSKTTIGIAHIGPGAFHRAHQAVYFDSLLERDPRWAISEIALRTAGVRDALAPQDGLYSLAELSAEGTIRVIGAIRELLVGSEQLDAAFARLCAPKTKVVTLTVTEKGYCLDAHGKLQMSHSDIEHDLKSPRTPVSTVGWLVEALRRRRAQGIEPFIVISCDNLMDNGNALRAAMIDYAQALEPGLARFIESDIVCPRTMVDSITPATDDALRARVNEALGVQDAWPVQREAFTQWVIEDSPALKDVDLASVGVTLAKDVSVYDRAKLRLVNGAHSTLAYLGSLRGRETVFDAINDAPLARFVEKLMREDLGPSLGNPQGLDVKKYIDAIIERYRNPAVRHLLAQIAWDGTKKLPVRIIATTLQLIGEKKDVRRLAWPIAAWMRFVVRQAKAEVAIVDPEATRLAAIGAACTGNFDPDLREFSAIETVFPAALLQNAEYRAALRDAYTSLANPNALP
ncbi:MAG TPA: mannitol dehydrogenase family protein [Steroidobacteraceae bacterium]|nr:mannitol dehydrogenase family protein [Steroidobacteraceae bacterium]